MRSVPLSLLIATLTIQSLVVLAPVQVRADPVALRQDRPERGLILEGGWPWINAGVWLGPQLGLAADWRLPAAAVGLSVGTRRSLFHGPRHGGIESFLAGGVLVPTIEPGIAVTATPALQAGYYAAKTHITLGLASPIEARLVPDVQLRIPVLLELGLGWDLGPLWLGLRGGTGAAFNFPGAISFLMHWSLWLRIPLSKTCRTQSASRL